MKQEEKDEDDEDELEADPDFFPIEEDKSMNEDFLYVVKKSLIIDEWKKRRFQLEKKARIAMKNARGVNTLGNLMALSFKKHLAKVTSGMF